MRDFLPTELKFIREHIGIDMTTREIGLYFGASQHEIITACETMEHQGYQQQPISLFTPGGSGVIARDVRLATIKDAYAVCPSYMTHAQFLAELPTIEAVWNEKLRLMGLL